MKHCRNFACLLTSEDKIIRPNPRLETYQIFLFPFRFHVIAEQPPDVCPNVIDSLLLITIEYQGILRMVYVDGVHQLRSFHYGRLLQLIARFPQLEKGQAAGAFREEQISKRLVNVL